MVELFQRIKAATRAPTAEERALDLLELHEARPGITEATLGSWTTATGQSGYDLLVQRVPLHARAVLELGAGNGPLLERLVVAHPELERVIGVDPCAADLALARDRLGDRVELRQERVESLGLEDASVDAVLTHHVFYLFDPPEPAVRQIARVLRPGGTFATAHWTFEAKSHALFAELMEVFARLTCRDAPHFAGWGDQRLFDRDQLATLLRAGGLGQPVIEEHVLAIAEPTQLLCQRLMGFFYSVELQSPETQRELCAEWSALLAATDSGDGLARLDFPFSIVTSEP
ncbi:MAG: class I SAM-dependent methyltransferase [Polyangiaceae bacterium]|nr:class I SAM-dependent methyltransferase [Polyangiaceae bacterium]